MRQQKTEVLLKRNVNGTVALLFIVDLSTNQERFIFFVKLSHSVCLVLEICRSIVESCTYKS